jgi:hypothetical protein
MRRVSIVVVIWICCLLRKQLIYVNNPRLTNVVIIYVYIFLSSFERILHRVSYHCACALR